MEQRSFNDFCSDSGIDVHLPAWPDLFGNAVHDWIGAFDGRAGRDPILVLSLFSGAGGLDIGFRDAGFTIVESVEIESKFCESLELNSGQGRYFNDTIVRNTDIRDYSPDFERVDFVIGGPPCQTFSAAGRRASGVLGTDDSRGLLFLEYVRLLEKLQPKGFLFENVYGIVGAQNGRPWAEIQAAFQDAGYRLHYLIVDAADYGAPQHRERLIIVGLKEGDFIFPRPLFGPDSIRSETFYTAGQAVQGANSLSEEVPNGFSGRYAHLIPEIPPGLNYSFFTEKLGHPRPVFGWRSKFSDFMYKADPNMPVRTIKAQGGQYTGPFHWNNRHFSVAEYKRLQTFPDEYVISGGRSAAIHQIGNSVPPQMARIFALAVRFQVFGRETPFVIDLIPSGFSLGFRRRKREISELYRKKAVELNKSVVVERKIILPEGELFFAFVDQDSFATCFSREPIVDSMSVRAALSSSVLSLEVGELGAGVWSEEIVPEDSWSLPIEKVVLSGDQDDDWSFVVAWKALEHILSENSLKADLVQLSNYYQYRSAISCRYMNSRGFLLDSVISAVSSGAITRRTVSQEEYARILGISVQQFVKAAKQLRSLGFEVRNWNTNSQIPLDHWLIPYEFPTLNRMSVQLRKHL